MYNLKKWISLKIEEFSFKKTEKARFLIKCPVSEILCENLYFSRFPRNLTPWCGMFCCLKDIPKQYTSSPAKFWFSIFELFFDIFLSFSSTVISLDWFIVAYLYSKCDVKVSAGQIWPKSAFFELAGFRGFDRKQTQEHMIIFWYGIALIVLH